MSPRQFRRHKKTEHDKALSITVRKHLSADALLRTVRNSFEQVGETRKGKAQIPMEDALMAAFAMFSLKDPSLLQFDKRRVERPINLKTIYKLVTIPCDTQMRTILDPVPPDELRPSHNTGFNALQRGKALRSIPISISSSPMTPSAPTALISASFRTWATISFSVSRRATTLIYSRSSIKLAAGATAMS
jgi:hypothetical protein